MWSWKSFLQISHIEVTKDICINILVLSGLLSRLCKQRRSLRSCKCSSNTSKPVCRTNNRRRSQYEANRGTRLGKILPNTADFYFFFYQTDNIRRFHTADFVQRTVCSPRL